MSRRTPTIAEVREAFLFCAAWYGRERAQQLLEFSTPSSKCADVHKADRADLIFLLRNRRAADAFLASVVIAD